MAAIKNHSHEPKPRKRSKLAMEAGLVNSKSFSSRLFALCSFVIQMMSSLADRITGPRRKLTEDKLNTEFVLQLSCNQEVSIVV